MDRSRPGLDRNQDGDRDLRWKPSLGARRCMGKVGQASLSLSQLANTQQQRTDLRNPRACV